MSSNTIHMKVKDLGVVVTGKTPSTNNSGFWGGRTPFVTPTDMGTGRFVKTERFLTEIGVESVKNSLCPKGTVMVSCIGTIGKIAIATEDVVTNQQINSIIPNNNYDSEYVYYLLQNSQNILKTHSSGTGTTIPIINKSSFEKIALAGTAEKDTQKQIAKILGDLDRKIELNRRMNETLEQIGQTLFKHYFIDNPDRENWDNRTLGEFFPIRTGKKDANFSTSDGQYPFFTCSQSSLRAPEYSFDGAALLLAGNGDFNIKYYRGKFEAYQRTYVLMPYNERFLGLLYFLMSIYLAEITGGSRGSVIKFITKGMIEGYVVKLPDDDQLKEVSGQFNQLTIAIEKNRAQTQTLEVMRDSLLPKLMDGSIAV